MPYWLGMPSTKGSPAGVCWLKSALDFSAMQRKMALMLSFRLNPFLALRNGCGGPSTARFDSINRARGRITLAVARGSVRDVGQLPSPSPSANLVGVNGRDRIDSLHSTPEGHGGAFPYRAPRGLLCVHSVKTPLVVLPACAATDIRVRSAENLCLPRVYNRLAR
jgi:hypothetical protein